MWALLCGKYRVVVVAGVLTMSYLQLTVYACVVCEVCSYWRRKTRKWIRVKWLRRSSTTCRPVNLLAKYESSTLSALCCLNFIFVSFSSHKSSVLCSSKFIEFVHVVQQDVFNWFTLSLSHLLNLQSVKVLGPYFRKNLMIILRFF